MHCAKDQVLHAVQQSSHCTWEAACSIQFMSTSGRNCTACLQGWACVQGVAKNFREIFSELVPGGKGELVMQRRAPVPVAADPEEDEEEAQKQQNASEKYSGVKVKVCDACPGSRQ